MGLRLAAIAATVSALAVAAPTVASSHPPASAWLAAPPRHAPAGVCYAHVRHEARYAPPPVPHGRWRLSPPPPGAPGPVWCLVMEADAAPPVLIEAGREGWIRVRCAIHLAAHRPRRPRLAARPIHHRLVRVAISGGCPVACVGAAIPPPPPVVFIPAFNPATRYGEPGPRVLSWAGKTG